MLTTPTSAFKSDDLFSIVCDVGIADVNDYAGPSEYAFPGSLEILWKRQVILDIPEQIVAIQHFSRASSDSSLPLCRSLLRFPNLRPPEDGLIGILKCPPSAQLHEAFSVHLVVQNRHPSRTADLYLDVDSSEAFVLAGPRHAHLSALLPGGSEELAFQLFPLLTGVVRLPNFRLYDRRKLLGAPTEGNDEAVEGMAVADGAETGKSIQIVMVGTDAWSPSASTPPFGSAENPHLHTIFVYPY